MAIKGALGEWTRFGRLFSFLVLFFLSFSFLLSLPHVSYRTGNHSHDRALEVFEAINIALYKALNDLGVFLEASILKCSMVTPGKACVNQASPEEVRKFTFTRSRKTFNSIQQPGENVCDLKTPPEKIAMRKGMIVGHWMFSKTNFRENYFINLL